MNKTFVPGTVIDSPWLNDINDVAYEILGNGTTVPATKAEARTNLGIPVLGTMATQNANAVAITGGSITGVGLSGLTTDLAVADGGTGASTPAAARTNLGFTSAVIDRGYATYTANTTMNSLIPVDNSIPQITEGTQIISLVHTPKSVTSRIRLRFQGQVAAASSINVSVAFFSGASANAIAASTTLAGVAQLVLEAEHVPGVTTPVTYTVRVGSNGVVNFAFNGSVGNPLFGGSSAATLVLEEIAV